MIITAVIIVVIISVILIAKVMRDIANDLRGMEEASKTTEERKNDKIREELEKRRAGK